MANGPPLSVWCIVWCVWVKGSACCAVFVCPPAWRPYTIPAVLLCSASHPIVLPCNQWRAGLLHQGVCLTVSGVQARGVPLASNQVQFSILYRAPERNGVLAACKELGVTLIAYSPMAQGLLTGAPSPRLLALNYATALCSCLEL